jgi:hypothetical protein
LTTNIWIWSGAHGGCDRSAEDAYSSMALDPTFAFVGGLWCPTLDFVIAFWIMIYVSHIVNFTILYVSMNYLRVHFAVTQHTLRNTGNGNWRYWSHRLDKSHPRHTCSQECNSVRLRRHIRGH